MGLTMTLFDLFHFVDDQIVEEHILRSENRMFTYVHVENILCKDFQILLKPSVLPSGAAGFLGFRPSSINVWPTL